MLIDIAAQPEELDIGITDPGVLDVIESGTATVGAEGGSGAARLVEKCHHEGRAAQQHNREDGGTAADAIGPGHT
jgi:hypothetical protein